LKGPDPQKPSNGTWQERGKQCQASRPVYREADDYTRSLPVEKMRTVRRMFSLTAVSISFLKIPPQLEGVVEVL
jgi:hypothetical protein